MRGLLASTFLLLHAPDEASALTRPVLTKGVNTEANLVRCDTLIPELHPTTRSRSVGTDDLLRLRDFGGIDASGADPGGFAVDRKRCGEGKSVSVRIDLGGSRSIQKKNERRKRKH